VGVFDITARRAAKRDPASFFRWAMSGLDPAFPFVRWLDVRTAPPPPETELTCDALAEFVAADRPEAPWICVTEFQTEPKNDDVERVLEYMLRFRRERRPEWDAQLKYLVGGLMLNLTGPHQPDLLAMPMPGMVEFGLSGRVVRLAVREEDAAATLARIASDEQGRSILPWVVLMRGGGELATIEEWKRLADLEPNPAVRLQYAGDALVFAELSDVLRQWKVALEGWNVRTSQVVLEWQAEAEVKTRRELLVQALETRCQSPVPSDLVEMIEGMQDRDTLKRWFNAAVVVTTFDDFRAAAHQR